MDQQGNRLQTFEGQASISHAGSLLCSWSGQRTSPTKSTVTAIFPYLMAGGGTWSIIIFVMDCMIFIYLAII